MWLVLACALIWGDIAGPIEIVLAGDHTRAMVWATPATRARIDGAPSFLLRPDAPHMLDGTEPRIVVQAPPPYIVAICLPGEAPPWRWRRLAFPLVQT